MVQHMFAMVSLRLHKYPRYLASSLLAEHCGDVLQIREVQPSPHLPGKLSAVSVGDIGLRVH
jgi:hypothetical protein